MDRRTRTLLVDIAVGLAAGLVATRATDLTQGPLRDATPDGVRRREERVSPGPSSSRVAARRLAEGLGHPLAGRRLELAGAVVHYGLGMAWGPLYGLLRRHGGLRPLGAGLVTGAALSLLVDEGLTPALGFSAPNRDYPAATHLRGFLAHLVWGAAAALAAEAAYRLTGTTPGHVGAPPTGSRHPGRRAASVGGAPAAREGNVGSVQEAGQDISASG